MEKVKRWQVVLITCVLVLTLYNVLPTLIYYSKPLSKPINLVTAKKVSKGIHSRVSHMQKDSENWVKSFSKNLRLKPKSIKANPENPALIEVAFNKAEDAKRFSDFLPKAGALIAFAPSQLQVIPNSLDNPNKVLIERKIGYSLDKQEFNQLATFSSQYDGNKLTPLYQNILNNRINSLALALAGPSSHAEFIHSLNQVKDLTSIKEALLDFSQSLVSFNNTFKNQPKLLKRYFQSFTQLSSITVLNQKLENLLVTFEKEVGALNEKSKLSTQDKNNLQLLKSQNKLISEALSIIKKNSSAFNNPSTPITLEELSNIGSQIDLGNRSAFISSIELNLEKNVLNLKLHEDISTFFKQSKKNSDIELQKEQLKQLVINEIAHLSQLTDEAISPTEIGYSVALNNSEETKSIFALDLSHLAQKDVNSLTKQLQNNWNRSSPEFEKDVFFISDYQNYLSMPKAKQRFGLISYAPVLESSKCLKGFKNDSLYVVAKGLNAMIQKYQQHPNSPEAEQFKDAFIQLQNMLYRQGYQLSYQASAPQFDKAFQSDIIFEKQNYYNSFLAATRENFSVRGSKKYAVLELSDLENRILTENKIETQIHDELVKTRDDYRSAQVDLTDKYARYFIPKPSQNVYFQNLLLSFKKYFRGDSRKVIKWGMDLSGGKSILIGLRDLDNKPITNKIELSEAVNELTQRVNKMGLSEVDIRVEGNNIALDFPSSKGLSATELIQGSSMHFHIVNEKFSSFNSPFYAATQKFLQEVWNEAVITNRKDVESIQAIAWKQLGGLEDGKTVYPKSEHAKVLHDNGFIIQSPKYAHSTSILNDNLSKLALYGGEDYSKWHGQAHPLLVVFNNFALEGSEIENIKPVYDPSQGHSLSFSVKGMHQSKAGEKVNSRDTLYSWTSLFAKDQVLGTDLEAFASNRGYRMAIILNQRVINDPQLNQPIKDSCLVSGSFTQHEINKLAADLKAGSLSFTPKILSEQNVSADLGHKERLQGVTATIVALVFVVSLMIGYYRFSGLIAAGAVLFNLLIMWATLQNLQATLTLSGIAGIILTVGMAVDANVLVFERIREELKQNKSLATSIFTGYKKAFSAIFDSNITTIIAAVILLNFDTGPIKGLAITLTIGIASSMFTALFLTRTFYTKWLQNTKATTLSMANWFQVKAFNFLKHAKWYTMLSSVVIIVGMSLMFTQYRSILGMDFTGGYSITLQLKEKANINYRKAVGSALLQSGARSSDVQIRELNAPNMLRIQLSSAFEQKGLPFYQMPVETQVAKTKYHWQKNPRINWVVDSLKAHQLDITNKSLESLDGNWSEMSGQLSHTTRNNALLGLSLAMLFILVYISFRFEIKYAISAIICILHDVLITLALVAILHLVKVPIQINMQIIAALMTIIGYSLNDTIIVFDRIREEKKLLKNKSLTHVINHSLSVTLNRTIMTSLTTFVVLFALVVLGGSKIFEFSLVMSLGVVLGTLSSLFVAPLILQYLHKDKSKKATYLPTAKNKSPA